MPTGTTDICTNFAKVSQFRAKYGDLPKPVFAHCKSGKRAGAMVMMQVACEQGMTGGQTLEKAKEMGFECDQPELERFVRQYVDSRAAAKSPQAHEEVR